MAASFPGPYLVVLSRPILVVVLVLAEAVVLRIAYPRLPISRLGAWAVLATLASLGANLIFVPGTGPAALPTSFLVSTAAGYAAILLVTRFKPPPLLLRVMILATAAAYAVVLLAVRARIVPR